MRVAIYARVSTELQEKEATILSQLEALRRYAQEHGYVVVHEFIDDGYSGTTLTRPGLDKLRDAVEQGDFDLVLIHSPDRLSRKAVHQGIVLEEFQERGIKVEFSNCQIDDTPEGQMMLGMQGIFAEYDRVKTAERTRRGRLHKAGRGVIVTGIRIYGYRYVRRDSGQSPMLVVDDEQAANVRMMFRWLLDEQESIRRIAQRLRELGIPAPCGGTIWYSSTVGRILSSEVYAGQGYYNKRRKSEPERYRKPAIYRRDPKSSFRARPREEWLPFAAPAIVDRDTWDQARAQLRQNSLHSPRNNRRHHYLLKGLLRCGGCGRTLTGQPNGEVLYYQHNRGEAPWLHEPCSLRPSYRTTLLEPLVRDAIGSAFQNPQLLLEEYRRRLSESQTMTGSELGKKQIALALKRTKAQEDRFIDAYKNEAMDLPRFKEEMGKLKARRDQLERQRVEQDKIARQRASAANAMQEFETFCERVAEGLEHLTPEEWQKLLRLVVDRIIVDGESIRIEGIIPISDDGVLRPTRSVH